MDDSSTILLLRSTIFVIATGLTFTPLLARTPYATAMSIGVTPFVKPPKATAKLSSPFLSNVVIPIFSAKSSTLDIPTLSAANTATTLLE